MPKCDPRTLGGPKDSKDALVKGDMCVVSFLLPHGYHAWSCPGLPSVGGHWH